MAIVYKFTAGAIADRSVAERQIRVIASDARPDRAKDVMVPSGCQIENYKRNNIVLADHDPTKPIGNAKIEVKADRVEALITFAPAGVSVKADEYCALAKAGVIKAVSVGFDPVEAEPRKGGGFLYKVWELLELSVLGGIPCNPGALVVERSLAPSALVGEIQSRPRPQLSAAVQKEIRAISSGLVCLDGAALEAWLRREWPHLKPYDRTMARIARRQAMTLLNRWRERKRESDFAKEFQAAMAARQKPAEEASRAKRRPMPGERFHWDPNIDPATNRFNLTKWLMQGGAPA